MVVCTPAACKLFGAKPNINLMFLKRNNPELCDIWGENGWKIVLGFWNFRNDSLWVGGNVWAKNFRWCQWGPGPAHTGGEDPHRHQKKFWRLVDLLCMWSLQTYGPIDILQRGSFDLLFPATNKLECLLVIDLFEVSFWLLLIYVWKVGSFDLHLPFPNIWVWNYQPIRT